jgi:DnaK suppressor protein
MAQANAKSHELDEVAGRPTAFWRELLLNRQEALLRQEKSILETKTELSPETTGEISRLRLHHGDLATDTQEIETLDSISGRNVKSLQHVDDALARLENGTFGFCGNCAEPIGQARLEAMPETPYCVDCEGQFEDQRKQMRSETADDEEDENTPEYGRPMQR